MNLWHDIDPGSVDAINTIIEINKGSHNKYEIDKKTGLIALDRVAHTSQTFPFDYGFIPKTLWKDNDPVDVIVLTTTPLLPGILVRVRPVAVMEMIDDGEADDKVIAVPVKDPRWEHVKDLQDLNPHTTKEMHHFYSTYKNLQGKEVKVVGFKGRKEAEAVFTEGLALYKKAYGAKSAKSGVKK